MFEFGVGDTYQINHENVREVRGKAAAYLCEHCGKPAKDWATIHGQSGDDSRDFMPLCRKCHIDYDKSGAYSSRSLSNEQVIGVKRLLLADDDFSNSEIGRAMDIPVGIVNGIRHGRIYT